MNNPKNYSIPSVEIFSYDCSHASYQNDGHFLPPPTNFSTEVTRPFPPFSNQETSDQCSPQKEKSIRKVFHLSRVQLKLVVGKKQSGLKKIRERTNVEVNTHFSAKKANKLIIDGSEKDVEAACSMVSSMLTKDSEKDPEEFKSGVSETEKVAKTETETEVEPKLKKNESTPNENLPSDTPNNSPLQENTSESTTTQTCLEKSFPEASSSPQEHGDIFIVPFPSERLAAIKAIKAVVPRILHWKKKDVKLTGLERFVRYFNSQTMSACDAEERKEVLNQMQRLSYALYTNCRLGKAEEWLTSLRQYKNILMKEIDQFVGAELHEEISLIYCNIANPSLEDLPNLLSLARSQIKVLEAEMADEEKRGLKHSKRWRRKKKRIRGDTSRLQFNP